MVFREYLEEVNKLASEHPELMDAKVVAATDSDYPVYFSVHQFFGAGVYVYGEGRFMSIKAKSFKDSGCTEKDINAICIN